MKIFWRFLKRAGVSPEPQKSQRELELIAKAEAELADERGNSSEVVGRVDLPSKEEFQKNNPMKTNMNFLC